MDVDKAASGGGTAGRANSASGLEGLIGRAQRCLANGYRPVPVLRHDAPAKITKRVDGAEKVLLQTPGKQPHGMWARKEKTVYGATPETIAGWSRLRNIADFPGLGIGCGHAAGADIDVHEPWLADTIETLAVEMLPDTPLRRVGQPPKRLLVYRIEGEPLRKAQTPELWKGNLKAKVEVLGHGQQFVAFGIHPDTKRPYRWDEVTPETTPLADLPAATQEQAAAFVAEAERRLRAAGYRTREEIKAEAEAAAAPEAAARLAGARPNSRHGAGDASPFKAVNDEAMRRPAAWVRRLFPRAKRQAGTGAWRVSSRDLGRELEEDLSISPAGIVDFGVHDQGDPQRGRRTPIDLMIEHGGAPDATEAARVLAEWLGMALEIGAPGKRRRATRGAGEPAGGQAEGDATEAAIRLEGGELDTIVAAAAAAVGKATEADPFNGFYRRGSLLVRAARLADEAELKRHGARRARGALAIITAGPDALRVALTSAVRWEKYDGKRKRWVPADAPAAVAKALLATAEKWDEIPILTGIVEAPTLRPDGTVLDRPGYDPATGLLFDPGGVEFAPIPERPTREQAEAALATLRRIVRDFPFVDGPSEAVAVAALMAPQTRKACRAAPLHAFTAPRMASGKTLLATLPGYVATGRAPALMPPVDDPAEERKRLLGVLMEGQGVNVFDNIEGAFKSDALCIVLTEPTFTDRILGVNGKASPSTASSFFATGNNLAVVGDLVPRTVSCALDPAVERPEEREFEVNLHEEVPRLRGTLAAAVLIVARAYIVAGEPGVDVPNFARFEDWSRFVRKPLVWLGMEDPCAGRERVEGRDTERAQLGALLEAWRENYPGEAVTVAEAIKLAMRDPHPEETEADTERRQALLEALRAVGGDGKPSTRAIGIFTAKHERRFEGGLRFEKHSILFRGVVRWRVTGTPKQEREGFEGFSEPRAEKSPEHEDRHTKDKSMKAAETNPQNPQNPHKAGRAGAESASSGGRAEDLPDPPRRPEPALQEVEF